MIGYEANNLDSEYIMSSDVNPMSVYNFRIRCKNKWGWSEWSPTLVVQPSTWPSIVDFDIYNTENNSGKVEVRWYEPDWHNSQVGKRFIIEVQHKNDANSWFEDVVNCNGNDPTYIGQVCSFETGGCSCFIEMSLFTDAYIGYQLYDNIVVRISA